MPRAYRNAILICGGLYGNRQSFEALLAAAAAHNIAADHIIITGDLAAYCADGAWVAEHCRTALPDTLIVRGNCERALAAGADDCGCGFESGSACSVLSVSWYRHAAATIAPDTKQWFATLPPAATITFAGRRLAVIHGGSDADNTFLFASTPAAEKQRHLDALAADGVIAGHCGIPFTQQFGAALWHNSGAVGMPANDGTARVWYSLWRDTAAGIRIDHHPLEYDHRAAAAAMDAAGLPPDYRDTLASGIWPSDSILPATEKQQQARPLTPPPHQWQPAPQQTRIPAVN